MENIEKYRVGFTWLRAMILKKDLNPHRLSA